MTYRSVLVFSVGSVNGGKNNFVLMGVRGRKWLRSLEGYFGGAKIC